MQVRWFRSLQFKLFVLMVVMVAAAILSVSWQNMSMFRSVLDRQNEENTVALGRRAAASLVGKLQFWTSLVSAVQHTSARVTAADSVRFVDGLVSSNREIIALQTFELGQAPLETAFAYSKDKTNPGWARKDSSQYEAKIRDLGKAAAGDVLKSTSQNVSLANLSPTLSLSIMQVRIPFSLFRDEKKIPALAVLSVWSNSFVSDLVRGDSFSSAVIRPNGEILFDASGGVKDSLLAPVSNGALNALWGGDVGFQSSQSKGRDGTPVLTVWSRLGQFDLALRLQKSLKAEKLQTAYQIRKIVLWSLILFLLVIVATYLGAVGISQRIRIVTNATAQIAAGNFSMRIGSGAQDEVGVLSLSVNHMAQEIERFLESRDEAVRREMELKTAEMVQGTFFPEPNSVDDGILTRGVFRPATECAGDLWGRFDLGNGRTLLMIADAVGHGASAALIAAMAFSFFATVQKNAQKGILQNDVTPRNLLQELHSILWEAGKGLTTMTMLVGIVDVSKKKLCVANAGHPIPVYFPSGGKPTGIGIGGSILGLTEEAEFEERVIDVNPGDRLFMNTDGLVECESVSGARLKPRQLRQVLVDAGAHPAGEFFDAVTREVDQFFLNTTLTDDVTILMMEIAAEWKGTFA